MSTETDLPFIAAAVDQGNLDALPMAPSLPEGAQGQVMLAARAARRVREEVADAISLACEGDLNSALDWVTGAEGDLATMRKRLTSARTVDNESRQAGASGRET